MRKLFVVVVLVLAFGPGRHEQPGEQQYYRRGAELWERRHRTDREQEFVDESVGVGRDLHEPEQQGALSDDGAVRSAPGRARASGHCKDRATNASINPELPL